MSDWQFEFEAPSGDRLMKRFAGVTVPMSGKWFNYAAKTWQDSTNGERVSNYDERIKSFKAFKRYLRKHPELRGQKITLASRFIGYDISAYYIPKPQLNH